MYPLYDDRCHQRRDTAQMTQGSANTNQILLFALGRRYSALMPAYFAFLDDMQNKFPGNLKTS